LDEFISEILSTIYDPPASCLETSLRATKVPGGFRLG
jgi:hypothetical protein